MRFAATYAAAALAAFACALPVHADDIAREGVGARRQTLDAMELKPFPPEAWAGLADWTNGDALTPDKTAGKVVLIMTFASWNPGSRQDLSKTQRLYHAHAEEGLIVLAVHHPTGWEHAAEAIAEKKVEHLVAHDVDGKFRAALNVDQDPDYYLIDRAGNLRFADIRTEAVSKAVDLLLGETADEAKAVPGAVLSAIQTERREARRARNVTSTVKPGARLNVEFEAPDESVYEKVKWPWRGLYLGKTEFDNLAEKTEHEAPSIELPEDGWFGERPAPHGRVTVMYLFDPTRPSSTGIVQRMNYIQSIYWADVDVVGAAVNFGEQFNNMQGEDREKVIERNTKAVQRFFEHRELNHAIMLAPPNTQQLYEGSNGVPIGRGENPNSWAWAFIISTDNKARYGGHPDWDSFEKNLREIMKVDPAVKARQRAEAAQRGGR